MLFRRGALFWYYSAENGSEKMYFGSVKFFKHLIYTVFFGWLATATFLAVFFGVKYGLETKKNSENAALANAGVSNSGYASEETSAETLFLRMIGRGCSSQDILDIIKDNDAAVFEDYIKNYAEENPGIFGEIISAGAAADGGVSDTAAEYTKLYPDLYAENPPTEFKEDDGTIYLTFDDGPSANTNDILYILNKYGIKATFFFCGGEDEQTFERMRAVADAGHTVGIHSISHDYEKIYESVESYLEDFYATYSCIYEATGIKPQIFRFPGGSINNYNRLTYKQIIAEMTRRGFVYYDWNVSGEDAVHDADWTSIYNNVLSGVANNSADNAIVLLHEKQQTVYVLEDVIDKLVEDGYHFGQLDNTVKPASFSYRD